MRTVRDVLPPEVNDCASWWNHIGAEMGQSARNMMLTTQVSAVSVAGDRGTATYATGGTVPVRWSDGRWRLD